jgi:pleiotropic regulator 1
MQYAFLGGGGGVIKKYKLPEGEFCHNMIQVQPGIINTLAISPEDVVVSGADNGSLWCGPLL